MSHWILSRKFGGSMCILRGEGLKINFSVAHVVHMKSEVLGNLTTFKLWPMQFSMIFLIIPTPGCPNLLCQIWNASTL
jgi:hypothetical protein